MNDPVLEGFLLLPICLTVHSIEKLPMAYHELYICLKSIQLTSFWFIKAKFFVKICTQHNGKITSIAESQALHRIEMLSKAFIKIEYDEYKKVNRAFVNRSGKVHKIFVLEG